MTNSDAAAPARTKRDRSPSFPFISLDVAIERLEALDKHFGRHPTPADRVGTAWGMKGQSSQADQTLAALRSYGLVQYEGIGAKRVVTITEDGRRYLRAQQESVKKAIRKQSALRPKSIRQFWASWGADRPVDAAALDTLILNNGFSDTGARSFLKVYDATVSYAGLGDSDKIEIENAPPTDNDTDVGDTTIQDKRSVESSRPRINPPISQAFAEYAGKPYIVMAGDRLEIRASVDLAGLRQLQNMLKKYEEILEIVSDANPNIEM